MAEPNWLADPAGFPPNPQLGDMLIDEWSPSYPSYPPGYPEKFKYDKVGDVWVCVQVPSAGPPAKKAIWSKQHKIYRKGNKVHYFKTGAFVDRGYKYPFPPQSPSTLYRKKSGTPKYEVDPRTPEYIKEEYAKKKAPDTVSSNNNTVLIVENTVDGNKEYVFQYDGVLAKTDADGITVAANYDVKIISDYTDNNHTWTFEGSDGSVTFPDNTIQTTAWAGGRVVSVPTHSTGSEGDLQGDISFSNDHFYYCIADYGQVGHQVTIATAYNGATLLNTNVFQLTKTGDTLQITVGDTISDSDGGPTSTVVNVTSDDDYTYVSTGGMAYSAVFPLTFTSTDPAYVPGGNIWVRVAWSGNSW